MGWWSDPGLCEGGVIRSHGGVVRYSLPVHEGAEGFTFGGGFSTLGGGFINHTSGLLKLKQDSSARTFFRTSKTRINRRRRNNMSHFVTRGHVGLSLKETCDPVSEDDLSPCEASIFLMTQEHMRF